MIAPKQGLQEWEIVCRIATEMGYPMSYADESEIMDGVECGGVATFLADSLRSRTSLFI